MKRALHAFTVALAALVLGACAAPGGGPTEIEVRSGTIEQINAAEMRSNYDLGVGAIVGGLAGAGLGSLIGAGTGREVAIAAGAIAGAVGGSYAQRQYFDKPQPGQQVIVRLTSGVLVSITQPVNPGLRPGQKVTIEGSGSSARVIPQG
ncbi:MAG TPA: glycine zipper 2TM domain-containing protein [Casimicrobiaceae bacterium]|jgi:outer membrane lipoprotein SlyB|nr:glycine zipper 2TM domain-containing protein [Casimicrobiaceae bacterium]